MMMIQFDHTEPPATPDTHPDLPPPPSPAPDVVPVRDPLRPEHPDPVKEPPTHEPPISAWARRESRARVRAAAALSMQRRRHDAGQ
jgi:hypothetical protein